MVTIRELPDDVLVDVLRRLAPRSLAAFTCICWAWRDAIDARQLLRRGLRPGRVPRIVKTPRDAIYLSLGRSEKRVYCAISEDSFQDRSIWHLNESYDGQMVWELKHHVDLTSFSRKLHALDDYHQQTRGPWILQDINYHRYRYKFDNYVAVAEKVKFEWDSDNDNAFDTGDMAEGNYAGYTGVLGFHPYKEIIFLNASLRRGVAYEWNTSEFQDLGNIWRQDYAEIAGQFAEIEMSFKYTPCWLEEFSVNNFEAQIED
ncbi:hypothetical protein BAE44_0000767 [Dichanthelium oligosanthes]|uniref:F-box domain-containing protein n=1 Tax=Dichanthelium oligosanthes TaxID=888268 RepID=A0A1E5WLK4_9POAL|nr:hypothetical protein BAE44_0000767 [Dichanthelium oligosanthes]